jgi:hypothetical protein
MNLFTDNLFSADHRSKMIKKYGYTQAMSVTVDDLNFEWTMESGFRQANGLDK